MAEFFALMLLIGIVFSIVAGVMRKRQWVYRGLAVCALAFVAFGVVVEKPIDTDTAGSQQPPAAPAVVPATVPPSPRSIEYARANNLQISIDEDGCERFTTADGLRATAAPLGGFACPPKQGELIELLRRYNTEYRTAPNDIRRRELRAARAREICALIPGAAVQNWLGILRDMEVLDNGRVALVVEISGTYLRFMTSGRTGSRLADETQVRPNTVLHWQLRDLRPGNQRVRFSAHLMAGGPDCFLGARETEVQMMIGTEFFVRFTDIYPVP